jgi:glucose/arabinose dehydrogenase
VAFKDGTLYIAEVSKISKMPGIEDKLDSPPAMELVYDTLPKDLPHGWKYLAFGPDGKLYFNIGAPCNICMPPDTHANLSRVNPDGTGFEYVAHGVRNSVGFDWHPQTKELWFTDNGRDWAGNDGPQDELNRIPRGQEGAKFGFPYCHANGIADPDVKVPDPCAGVILPAALTGPHAAGLGIKFYTGAMFPQTYRNVAFIARRGSWNREQKFGYDVVVARPQADGTATLEPFMTGLLDAGRNEFYGRPTYLLQMPDGAMLVSDEQNGAVYRISAR